MNSKEVLRVSSLEYFAFENGKLIPFRDTEYIRSHFKKGTGPFIWSARLGTGILGLTTCWAGNLGPKSKGELILGVGDEGLRDFIRNGFSLCPACHPENVETFWNIAADAIKETYHTDDPKVMLKVPHDARSVNWEGILPVIKTTAGRYYIASELTGHDLLVEKIRFEKMGFELPVPGWFNPAAPQDTDPFTPYELPWQKLT